MKFLTKKTPVRIEYFFKYRMRFIAFISRCYDIISFDVLMRL